MKKIKMVLFVGAILVSGLVSAQSLKKQTPLEQATHEASEGINRTSLSRARLLETLIEDGISKDVAEKALKKAEKEWNDPNLWNEKAQMSAESARHMPQLSCDEILRDLIDRQKFTVEEAKYGVKSLKFCK